MTETIQVILTFVSLAIGFTFFVLWLTEKEKCRKFKKDTEDVYIVVGELMNQKEQFEKMNNTFGNRVIDLERINHELGNVIETKAQEIKDLKKKNRIKGRK